MSTKIHNIKQTVEIQPQQKTTNTQQPTVLFEYTPNVPVDNLVSNSLWDENTKSLMFSTIQEIGISDYNGFSLLKNDHIAIQKSQSHLIDLIKYYEGDSNYYYEAYTNSYSDGSSNITNGFGNLSKKSVTQEQAYEDLAKNLKSYAKEVERLIGKEKYKTLPNSIKEGLIDLNFNKGLSTIKSNKELLNAIKENDYSTIIKNLVYTKNNSGKKKGVEEAGLYRRSLSRMILAVRDLKGEKLSEAKKEIEEFYKKSVEFFTNNHTDKSDLDKIYEQFTTGKISGEPKSLESYKITIDDSFKGKGVLAVARKMYDSCKEKYNVSFEKFYQEFLRINNSPESIKIGQDLKIPYIQNLIDSDINSKDGIKVDTIEADTTKILPEVVKTSSDKQVDESENDKTWIEKAWDKVCNFFKNIFSSKKQQDEIPYEELSALQKMMKRGETEIKKDGDFEIITTKYKVKSGDTIWRLSREFTLSEDAICMDNNIADKSKINVDQELTFRKIGYTVKKGDTLYSISKKTGLTIEILKDANNIEDASQIKEGALLEIPGYFYTVKAGDNLNKIARLVGTSVDNLIKINNLTSDLIHPGDIIKIIYNDADYNVSSSQKQITVDRKTNTTTEIVDMSHEKGVASRPLLKQKRKINSKVVATRKVFEPTYTGKLSGKTIIVNAGHGYSQNGIDCGTPGINGLDHEWLLNYDNAMQLKDKLCAQGANVIFLQGKKRLILDELDKKENKADLFISVHVNSAGESAKDRTQIYYYENTKQTKAKQKSIKLAEAIEKNLDEWILQNEKINENDRFILQGKQDYAQVATNDGRTGLLREVMKKQNIPAVLWEVAFMSSSKGRERLSNPDLIGNYANEMTKAIIKRFEEEEKGK